MRRQWHFDRPPWTWGSPRGAREGSHMAASYAPTLGPQGGPQAKTAVREAEEQLETVLKGHNDQVGKLINLVGFIKSRILTLEPEGRSRADERSANKGSECTTHHS